MCLLGCYKYNRILQLWHRIHNELEVHLHFFADAWANISTTLAIFVEKAYDRHKYEGYRQWVGLLVTTYSMTIMVCG